ncbi:MAG TPA: A/G-specific adenine glycosylase [Baekduia sp.]|uniref:A/G-specific adenine glycosylase n=1 Tax=Baekduia sp. TaxID=2600305 RepID=UPI002D76CDDB|nr:A/G-specific adenine glycosylase [Baekduia sp.]HET6508611.1 A/G-specific adenine glycosylase [Baekduia sp.]
MPTFADTLLEWYAREARDLPWRRTRDPYAILVSEVMLQQTQVARVVPRWEAWLERWPTAAALAAAPVPEVLAAWVGLGYNRRALRLREACAVVARDGWPEDLRELPGIGPYTAAAVGAFAFGRPELPVDTNVRRVLERTGFDPGDAPSPDVGQALMELGAVVCRARDAACEACPVAGACASAGRVVIAPRGAAGTKRERFEDSNRWVRGRIVEALATGAPLPDGIELGRLERAIESLVADGLVRRDAKGLSLPV